MTHKYLMTWNMARKLENVENETHTHCRTWSMSRKLRNEENDKLTCFDLEYGEKY
jgi:hypothetical protein